MTPTDQQPLTANGAIVMAEQFNQPYQSEEAVRLATGVFKKQFTGDLTGRSEARVIRVQTAAPKELGFSGTELFSGTLSGRPGTFVMLHATLVDDGQMTSHIDIVPGSGTGSLTGIRGTMSIIDHGDSHKYALTYRLPGATEPA